MSNPRSVGYMCRMAFDVSFMDIRLCKSCWTPVDVVVRVVYAGDEEAAEKCRQCKEMLVCSAARSAHLLFSSLGSQKGL